MSERSGVGMSTTWDNARGGSQWACRLKRIGYSFVSSDPSGGSKRGSLADFMSGAWFTPF